MKVRIASVGCTHSPFTDMARLDEACAIIRDFKPDVIAHLGDGPEADAASKFDNERSHELQEEYRHMSEVLRRLRLARKKAKHTYIEGNHDHNLRAHGRLPKKLRGLVQPQEWVEEFAKGRWHIVPYVNDPKQGVYRVGPVSLWHGFGESKLAVRREVVRFVPPNGLGVHSHTHRPHGPEQVWLDSSTPLPYWVANTGTLGPLRPDWSDRVATDRWGGGVVLVEAMMEGPPDRLNWWAETIVLASNQLQPPRRTDLDPQAARRGRDRR